MDVGCFHFELFGARAKTEGSRTYVEVRLALSLFSLIRSWKFYSKLLLGSEHNYTNGTEMVVWDVALAQLVLEKT